MVVVGVFVVGVFRPAPRAAAAAAPRRQAREVPGPGALARARDSVTDSASPDGSPQPARRRAGGE